MKIKPHAPGEGGGARGKDQARNQKGNRKYCEIKYKHHTPELWDIAGNRKEVYTVKVKVKVV